MKQKFLTALMATPALSLIACGVEAKEPQRPNIIFVLVDDLGKEWISECGAELIETPNIDAIAQNGIEFTRAYSMPQSTPTRAALFTGQAPWRSGWINHYDAPRWGHGAGYDVSCNPSFVLELQKAGYSTCAAGKWQLNDFRVDPNVMNKIGFDEYCMWTGAELGTPEHIKKSEARYWNPYIHTKDGSRTYTGEFGPDVYSNFILDFMSENKQEPMFIYYPMTLTHTPFTHTPHAMNAKTTYEMHKAMVEYTDYIIGRIIKKCEDLGIADNTYLIFTTDNGTVSSVIGKRNGRVVKGGKARLSENGINAPFFVLGPKIKKGTKADNVIDVTDYTATILDLASVKANKKYEQDGKSFAPVLFGDKSYVTKKYPLSMGCHAALLSKDGRVQNVFEFRDRVFFSGKYKIYVTTERSIDRVYDMESDPFEEQNLIGKPEVMKVANAELEKLLEMCFEKDMNPQYNKLESPYALSPEQIRLNANKSLVNGKYRSNFSPSATQDDLDKFVNAKPKNKNSQKN